MNYTAGAHVVTRRGKRGVVVSSEGDFATGTVRVRFESHEFDMEPGQLVLASAYDRMGKGYSPNYSLRGR